MSDFNVWFLSLSEGRQKSLRENKWALASAAFEAGQKVVDSELLEALIKFVEAMRHGKTKQEIMAAIDEADKNARVVIAKVKGSCE